MEQVLLLLNMEDVGLSVFMKVVPVKQLMIS